MEKDFQRPSRLENNLIAKCFVDRVELIFKLKCSNLICNLAAV